MSITSPGPTQVTTSITAASPVQAVSLQNASTDAASGVSDSDDTAHVSKRGEMMARLKKLAESDPAKFKEVAKKISDALSAAASSETDLGAKKMMTSLAAKFSSAAESGDLSALAPKQGGRAPGPAGAGGAGGPPPSGHHGHHGGGRAKVDAIVSSVVDALDPAKSTSATASANTANTAPVSG